MTLPEQLRQAREAHNLSQEALAEKLNLSRQAISKWELGASAPTPENLQALSDVLGVPFTPDAPDAPKPPNPWKIFALSMTALFLLALLSALLYAFLFRAVPDPSPTVTGVSFYDETGAPLHTEAGWYFLSPGETVITAVTFDAGTDPSRFPDAAILYLTPAGSETFEQREQLALRAIGDGESRLVLFIWEVPQDLMDHLEVVLECLDGYTVTYGDINATSFPPAG